VFGTAILASAVLAFGCGCGSSSGHNSAGGKPTASTDSGMTTSPASASGTGTPSTSPSSSAASGSGQASGSPAACPTSSLRVATAPGSGGAAGSFYFDLTFTNTGSKSCTLYGYPGVSFITASGRQLGAAATEDPTYPRELVTLTPGAVAHAELRVTDAMNYPSPACQVVTAHRLRVFPPGQTNPLYLTLDARACAITSVQILSVQTVQPGNGATG
jgi:hypothetical protein